MPERLRSGGFVLVPALPVVGLFVYWTAQEGGYLPTTWQPTALVVLGLLVATALGLGLDRLRLSRPAAIALGLLTAYTAWSYLSIAWAASPGDALDGSNRTLLFLLLFGLFALLPWRAWSATAVLTVFALGIGAVAVVTLVRLGSAETVPSLFGDGRLRSPLGYVNANAAMFLVETMVALSLAARRELPAPLRGLLLACASAALSVSVLAQSRGWLFAFPVVLVATFLLVPGRVRLALWSLPVAVAGLLSLSTLLDVFRRSDAADSDVASLNALIDAAGDAGRIALLLAGAVLVAGVALALLDRRVAVSAGVARGANRVGAVLAAVAVVGAVAAALVVTDGRPDQKIADYWDRSHGYQETEAGTSRFAAVGSNRPDFWEVSWNAFREHPVGGLGQDNWGDFYLRERASAEQPRWTHSLELRLLAHTGIVGFLLFAGFLGAVAWAALRCRGRRLACATDPDARWTAAAAAIALLPLVVWLVHGSVDWFWEIPALSGPAFAFAGLAVAVTRPRSAPQPAAAAAQPAAAAPPAAAEPAPAVPQPVAARPAARSPWRTLAAVVAGGLALLAAVVLALPYLAERDIDDASANWSAHPAAALERLDRAAGLNPLSARADLFAGVIALENGDARTARARFDRAVERDPDDWFAHFGRGLAESELGERPAARADYVAANRLNPGDALVAEALRRVDRRRPLDAAEAFAWLREDVRALTSGS